VSGQETELQRWIALLAVLFMWLGASLWLLYCYLREITK
jgi:hypothetical protein